MNISANIGFGGCGGFNFDINFGFGGFGGGFGEDTGMSTGKKTLIDKLASGEVYPDYKVIIAGPVSFTSVLSEPLAPGVNVRYGPDSMWTDIFKNSMVGKMASTGVEVARKSLGYASSLVTGEQTTLKWTGSDNPTLTLKLLFSSNSSGSPLSNVRKALSTLYPLSYTGGIALIDGVYTPPMGYTGTGFGSGLFAISIGSWFYTPRVWLCTGASPIIHPVMDENGKPSYAEIDFTFQTYKLPTASDVTGWFRG